MRSFFKGCRMLILQIHLALNTFFFFFASSGVNYLCWPVAAHFAPMDTHAIATKPSLQLMVLGHGGPFRLLPHYHPNEKPEFLFGWMENRGGSGMAGRTINPLCEFWSLRCCTLPVLLASSTATVTLTNCLPSWVNVLLQSSGSPFLHRATCLHHCCFAVCYCGKWSARAVVVEG